MSRETNRSGFYQRQQNGSATWQISDGQFLMMWNQKILQKLNQTNSTAVADVLKYEIENFITVRPPCYCVPFNWCGASRFYCDLIIRRVVFVSSSNGKRLKMESGDCKCAVEEMPTKKVLVRDEKIKQSPHCVVGQSDDASLIVSTEIFSFSWCWSRKLLLPTECDQAAPIKVTIRIMWHETRKQTTTGTTIWWWK